MEKKQKVNKDELAEACKTSLYRDVAKQFGVSMSTVFNTAKKYGIKKKPGQRKMKKKMLYSTEENTQINPHKDNC